MNYKLTVIITVLIILLSFSVTAFAVTPHYWDKNPLYLDPGETTIVDAFGIQNMVGGEDTTVRVVQTSGFEVAEILDDSEFYDIPFGTKDNFVKIKVSIPKDAKIGTEYNIGASFTEAPTGDREGSVQFVAGQTNSILVIVGEKIDETGDIVEQVREQPPTEELPRTTITEAIEKSPSGFGAGILIAILLLVIIFYVYELKKKKQ